MTISRFLTLTAITFAVLTSSAGAVTLKPGKTELTVKPGQKVVVPLVAPTTAKCDARVGKVKNSADMSDSTRIVYSFKVSKTAKPKTYKLHVNCEDMSEAVFKITVKPARHKKAGKDTLTKKLSSSIAYLESDIRADEGDTPGKPWVQSLPSGVSTAPSSPPSTDDDTTDDGSGQDDLEQCDSGDGSNTDTSTTEDTPVETAQSEDDFTEDDFTEDDQSVCDEQI
jgi:hypothetical protein